MGKKILYMKAQGLGDIIGGIPFLSHMKNDGNKVFQTFYDMRHLHSGVEKLPKDIKEKYKKWPMYGGRYSIVKHLKEHTLVEDIVYIPYGIWNMILFFIKNFRKYDEVIIPIKTKPALFISYILGKKRRIVFNHINDISQYTILADGEIQGKSPPLSTYKKLVHWHTTQCTIPTEPYIAVYPSIYERSLEASDWHKIFDYCTSIGYKIVILGGDREKWFESYIGERYMAKIINLLGKNNLSDASYIVEHASLTINGNGGIMWIANLLNPNCINIHTTSAYLMQPPVDNKTSFNIRTYTYDRCKPCESAGSTIGEKGITGCVFYGTGEEGACRKAITSGVIISCINKILSNKH